MYGGGEFLWDGFILKTAKFFSKWEVPKSRTDRKCFFLENPQICVDF